jgi:protein NrfD
MQAQGIVEFSSTRANPDVDPALHIWGWEVPVYLFLGGLVAGLLVLHALVVLTRKQERMPASYGLAPLFAVPLLGLGLGALFLDLEYKLHVLQFYTAFRLGALGRLPGSAAAPWGRIGLVRSLAAFGQRHEALVARANLFLGLVLGVYTGVLLSSFAARPFWNSALLGPLCLVSGASAGIALAALLARDPQERHTLVRVDLLLLLVEAALVLLWLNGMANAGEAGRDAAQLVLGGSHTAVFWLLFVTVGLVVPFLLEFMALRHRWAETLVAPVLVLIGGIVFRFVLVDAGQLSAFGG